MARTSTAIPLVGLSNADESRLKRVYTFRQPNDVVDELKKSPFLAPLLLEAYDRIQAYFPSAKCSLGVFRVPDEDDHRTGREKPLGSLFVSGFHVRREAR